MSDPDPNIWSRLPFEVLLEVLEFLDKPNLFNWALVSRDLYPYVKFKIWNTLEIKAFEFEKCRRAREDPKSTTRCIVEFLTHKAHRQDLGESRNVSHINVGYGEPGPILPLGTVARLPSAMVRHLILSDRIEPSVDPRRVARIIASSTGVLSELFLSLDGLTKVSYNGQLRTAIFANIMNVKTLTSLSLRMGLESFMLPEAIMPMPFPWIVVELDFGALATLHHLRFLRLRGSQTGSPLSAFLTALTTDEPQSRGFPITLKYLSLCDRYYAKIPFLHQYLASLIKDCDLLDTIDLEILVDWIIQGREDFETLKIPSRVINVSLQSWSQLSNERVPVLGTQWRTEVDRDGFAAPRPPQEIRFISDIGRILDNVVSHDSKSIKHRPWRYLRTMRFKKEPRGPYMEPNKVVQVSWARESLCDFGYPSTEDRWIVPGCRHRRPRSVQTAS